MQERIDAQQPFARQRDSARCPCAQKTGPFERRQLRSKAFEHVDAVLLATPAVRSDRVAPIASPDLHAATRPRTVRTGRGPRSP